MSTDAAPTLGRILHFKPASQDTSPAHQADVYPAFVTGIYLDDPAAADLCTFGQRSIYFQINVKRLDDEHPERGGWFWPPRST